MDPWTWTHGLIVHPMSDRSLLESVARKAMQQYGLEPDFPAAALAEASAARATAPDGVRDLRNLPWSSIDNDESRDLDQLEVCDGGSGSASRVLVAIADVDAFVAQGDAVDGHAEANTTSVYTAARIFPMLPETLSTDKTSLLPDVDRAAIVIQLDVDAAGLVQQSDVYRAMVRNRAKLTYDEVGAWLEGRGPAPAALARVGGLEAQLRQQDRIAQALRASRQAQGALDFDRAEMRPVMEGDRIADLKAVAIGRARDLIEDFMIAANGATASFLAARRSPSLRRVVRTPERWPRIVSLAAERGATLPGEPDARALEAFLKSERQRSPDTFDELSLSVIKLLGRGEYAVDMGTVPRVTGKGDSPQASQATGHFALAVSSYSHSTAPNRRYPGPHHAAAAQGGLDGHAAVVRGARARATGTALHDAGGRREQGRAARAEGRGRAPAFPPDRRGVRRHRHGRLAEGHVGADPSAEGRGQARTRIRGAGRRQPRPRKAHLHQSRERVHRLRESVGPMDIPIITA